MIFSIYELNEKLFEYYVNNDFKYRGSKFNHDVLNLPKSSTNLSFDNKFNRNILKLGYRFNQQYELYSNIKYLNLDCNNSYIIDSLPNSIVELELNYSFNLQMDNLPTLIKKIIICHCGSYDADLNCLPVFVEELQLNKNYKKRIKNSFKS